jgi:hypothetical protein
MFNFNFGKKKPDKREIIKVSIIVSLLIAVLSSLTGINETKLWDLLDEFQRKYLPLGILNELIIRDPEKTERRVIRDVTREIDEVTPEYDRIISDYDRKYKQKYIEKPPDGSEAQRLLGGEMRICAIWVDDCPKE